MVFLVSACTCFFFFYNYFIKSLVDCVLIFKINHHQVRRQFLSAMESSMTPRALSARTKTPRISGLGVLVAKSLMIRWRSCTSADVMCSGCYINEKSRISLPNSPLWCHAPAGSSGITVATKRYHPSSLWDDGECSHDSLTAARTGSMKIKRITILCWLSAACLESNTKERRNKAK